MYRYRCYSYHDGILVNVREEECTSARLYREMGSVGKLSFLELLNKWNTQGQGSNLSNMMYVYIAL